MSLFSSVSRRRRPRHRGFDYISNDHLPTYRVPAPNFETLPMPGPPSLPPLSSYSASPTYVPSSFPSYYTHSPSRSHSPSPPYLDRRNPRDDDYVILILHKDSAFRSESYEFEFLYPYGAIYEGNVKVGGLRKDVEQQLNVERGKRLVELYFDDLLLDDDNRALVDYGIQSSDEIMVKVLDPIDRRELEREKEWERGRIEKERLHDDLRRDFQRKMDLRGGYGSLPDDIPRRHATEADIAWELEQERKKDAEIAERRRLERERRIREHEEKERRIREQELQASAERERRMHEEELKAREARELEAKRLEQEEILREQAEQQRRDERDREERRIAREKLLREQAEQQQRRDERDREERRISREKVHREQAEQQRRDERDREERRAARERERERERRIRDHELEAERRRGRSRSRPRPSKEPEDRDPHRPKTKEEIAAEEYRRHFHQNTAPSQPTDDTSSYSSSPDLDSSSETSYGHSSRRSRYSHRSRSRTRASPPTDRADRQDRSSHPPTDAPPPKSKPEKVELDNTWALLADPRLFTPPKFQSTSETIATLQAANNADIYPLVEAFIKSTLSNPDHVIRELRKNEQWVKYHHKLTEGIMAVVLKLDGLDTGGDEEVRRKRKEFVDEMEARLRRLDALKHGEGEGERSRGF